VVRACRGRSFTLAGQSLLAHMAEWPVQQHYTLTVKRRPDREPRQAQVVLRFGRVELKVPKRVTSARQSLPVQVVEGWEPSPPADEEPVH